MRSLTPKRLKPSRVKRMKESQKIEKEARQIHAEFEEHLRDRRRLARKARKFSNSVRKRNPNMQLADDPDTSLHSTVERIATSLFLNPLREDDPANQAESSFQSLFDFLKRVMDVPWLKNGTE